MRAELTHRSLPKERPLRARYAREARRIERPLQLTIRGHPSRSLLDGLHKYNKHNFEKERSASGLLSKRLPAEYTGTAIDSRYGLVLVVALFVHTGMRVLNCITAFRGVRFSLLQSATHSHAVPLSRIPVSPLIPRAFTLSRTWRHWAGPLRLHRQVGDCLPLHYSCACRGRWHIVGGGGGPPLHWACVV